MFVVFFTQTKGKVGTQLRFDMILGEAREQSEIAVSVQQFEAALKLLQDEDFLVVTGQTIRLS